MPRTKRKTEPEQMYLVLRGIENEAVRFEPGAVVSESKLEAVFSRDTLDLWLERDVIVPAIVEDKPREADDGPER